MLDVEDIPVLWMGNEAMIAGIKLRESVVDWNWEELATAPETPSLKLFWWLVECLPFPRLTYESAAGTTWCVELAS